MAENIKLLKTVEQFITNKCLQKKKNNSMFEIDCHSFGQNNLFVIYDKTHYIHCLFNNKKELEELSKIKTDSHLLIKDSKLDLIFYKAESAPKLIQCIIIFIINDFEIKNKANEEEDNINIFDEEKIGDINGEYRIIKKLKKFLYDYIKKNDSINDINFSLNKLFMENAVDDINIFNNDYNKIEQIELIKNMDSEIKMKEGKNINQILDELYPELKEELIGKYIAEMPDEIVELQKKYKKIKVTNETYKNYINNINNKEKELEKK